MLAELGHLALILAGGFAGALTLMVLFYSRSLAIYRWAKQIIKIQFYLLLFSMIALGISFYQNEFSVLYVAQHSNSLLPWYYRLSAVWGGHEGSLLLWIVILSAWSALVAFKAPEPKNEPSALFFNKVFGILAYLQFGFILFIVFTSNPFRRVFPAPFDGADLNPLLQDVGLIFHPPLLYAGYVGFALAFAFVVAGLWHGQLNRHWLRMVRPYTLGAWLTLTLGIALGSYWAYYELGWGGWWFWDPVENASLMPWLIGTALIHSLIASEKRGLFLTWTALLAIISFSLSLIGTFLVRSGVLTSVHAFASDPMRGVFILLLLVAIVLPALLLLIFRTHLLQKSASYDLISKEFGLLLNNWLFIGACFVVFFGTMYPLITDVFNWGKISVGAPYFNRLIVPLAFLSLILLGFAPIIRWKKDQIKRLKPLYFLILILAIVFTWIFIHLSQKNEMKLMIAIFTAMLALSALMVDYGERIYHLGWKGWKQRASQTAMFLAHLGYVIMVLGITATGLYSQEQDLSIKVNQKIELADYQITLLNLKEEKGENYNSIQGRFLIQKNNNPDFFKVLLPSKRTYFSSTMPMTESARLITPTHDLYIALGEPINSETWAIRLQYKPFIIWIWLGGLIMAMSAGIGIFDRVFRQKQ